MSIAGLEEWHLAEPAALIALVLVPLPAIAAARRRRIAWPTLDGFAQAPRARAPLRLVPDLLLAATIALLALALARPQAIGGRTRIAGRGVAIVVAIDRSASMSGGDFATAEGPQDRLDAAKATLSRFVEGRPDDLIGVVAFADVPRRVAPPTLDHGFVLDAVRAIRPARGGEGGTNLGQAIAQGLGELRGLAPTKKVLVLMTDGRDSPSSQGGVVPIPPEDAAALAPRLGITLHTVAIGGPAKPVEGGDPALAQVADPGPDFARLERLAALGGGRPFRAADAGALESVFAAIDALERSPVAATIRTRYREGYPVCVAAALACLLLARLLRVGPLRILP